MIGETSLSRYAINGETFVFVRVLNVMTQLDHKNDETLKPMKMTSYKVYNILLIP